MKIEIELKAIVDDKCSVVNYKSKHNPIETGRVIDVNVQVYKDGSYHVGYRVLLDRKSTGKGKGYLFLHVGDDKITKI